MTNSAQEIIERADALYAARSEQQSVRLSVDALDHALAREFNYELAWRLSRALFFLGQEAQDTNAARGFHARAVESCERAARAEPSRVEGHFWLGVNLALLAAHEKPLSALRRAHRARRHLRQAVALNPGYHAAGPLRVLARLEAKLPNIFGGGHARAHANFERAIAIAPANTVTRLYFAEMLLDAGDQQHARQQLRALLDAPLDPAWKFETERDRRLAQAMLQNMSHVETPKSNVKTGS
ncbi:MAG TPA: TRAP transporter TatT component family protein [Pyrinomonadaceae bacterium]